ncbi:MAG TPA: type I-B CRISPR-associated endonuclease Cas1 [Candidatus Aciduliprofundum boonei]|uniref:CRISPR-associated endonuclease Cas1 n=1 Tax=Candidatus Aciduliprofundum boonei TaxID=379547 RepID=A0A7J3T8N4_9ARCH|nr:type I-B CRISPR-associated endonuclease Cas1 [Candidatus Aciduliprofundum boonei]
MKNSIYIMKHGKLVRDENTVYFIEAGGEKHLLPVNKIEDIYAYGKVTLTSQVISYFSEKGIVVHFFNKYGFYQASLYPREKLVSGTVLVKQATHYLEREKRLYLAKSFVDGATGNIIRNLKRWKVESEKIEEMRQRIWKQSSIPQVMEVEGKIREEYYSQLDNLVPEEFKMVRRERQPPSNKMNALISFGNMLVYSTVLTEIYNTQLNPTISYLHEPSERRFSLSLDIAEIFKPIIVDRIIMKLVRKNMLKESDFRRDLNAVLLSDSGKRKFLSEYDARLQSTIMHRRLGKKVSMRRLIRIECYKLIKHILGAEKYRPLVAWW